MRMVAEEARYKNIFQTASQNKESLKRRLKRIDEEEMTANQNVSRLEKQTIKAEEQLDALKKENEELEKKILIIRKQVEEKNRLFSEKARNIQVLDIQKNQAESKFSALKKMEAGYQWYKDGVKAIFKRKDKGDQKVSEAGGQSFEPGNIIGLMADILEPEHSFETAVEAVLGDSLQYIITKDQKTGKDSIEFLKQNNAGRSGFIPVSAIKATRPNSSGASPSTGRLLNHISIKSGY